MPARAASVALCRLFVATVLRSDGAEEETVADAKLAVSEIVTAAILGASQHQVVVEVAVAIAGVEIAVAPPGGIVGAENVERLDIARALFPSTQVVGSDRVVFSIEKATK